MCRASSQVSSIVHRVLSGGGTFSRSRFVGGEEDTLYTWKPNWPLKFIEQPGGGGDEGFRSGGAAPGAGDATTADAARAKSVVAYFMIMVLLGG